MPNLGRPIARAGTDELGDAVRQTIRAFHGSPYDFDKFDASKIGTGEGAQAYGHGLYFAGNEGVARQYRDTLKDVLDTDPTERQALDLQDAWNDWMSKQQLVRDWDNPPHGRGNLLAELGEPNPHIAAERAAAAEWQRLQAEIELATKNRGRMYEVEIAQPESALLDYDRPFSTPAGVVGAEVLRRDNPAAVSERALRAIQDGSWRMESFAGRSPYETAAVELTRLAKTRGGAQALTEAGIPGVRYLDNGSRSAGQGTRNYVMFPGTEDSIRILRKYGLLAPIAGATMSPDETLDSR